MDVSITSSSEEDSELRSLYLWLRDAPYVRRNASVVMTGAQPATGQMGATFDGIQLILDSGFQLGNLVLAWHSWRATRPTTPEITFELNGTTVTLSGQDAETATRLLAALERR